MAYTPEELAQLTEEERAGLEDPDLADDEQEEEEEEGAEAGAAAAEAEAEAGDAAADDAAAAAAATDAGADDAANAGRDDGAKEEDDREPLPQINTKAPEEAEAKLADIDKREDELTEKFDDGDITSAEYRAELRKLERERGDIEKAQLEHDLATKFNEAQVNANWERDVKQFLDANPEVVASQLRMQSFDMVVQRITAETMKAGKAPGTADLKKAYAEWSEQLGIKPATKEDDKKDDGKQPTTTDAAKPKETAKPRPAAPPTLANVPSAQVSGTDDGKWASLDRLMETDPMGFEKALAKLPEAEREAYLAAS